MFTEKNDGENKEIELGDKAMEHVESKNDERELFSQSCR